MKIKCQSYFISVLMQKFTFEACEAMSKKKGYDAFGPGTSHLQISPLPGKDEGEGNYRKAKFKLYTFYGLHVKEHQYQDRF